MILLIGFILIVTLAILLVSGSIPKKLITIEWRERSLKALFSDGPTNEWKPLLAKVIKEAESDWIEETGLFLHINRQFNLDGRFARNVGEICAAVVQSPGSAVPSSAPCPPNAFAKTQFALEYLRSVGFLQTTRYAGDQVQSFGLNALGHKAFEQIREDWIATGAVKQSRLAELDLGFPGLQAPILAARDWYRSKQINSQGRLVDR